MKCLVARAEAEVEPNREGQRLHIVEWPLLCESLQPLRLLVSAGKPRKIGKLSRGAGHYLTDLSGTTGS